MLTSRAAVALGMGHPDEPGDGGVDHGLRRDRAARDAAGRSDRRPHLGLRGHPRRRGGRRASGRLHARPRNRRFDGAGELGFFPPYSWWPLWGGLTLAMIVLGVVIGWWLAIIGAIFGVAALQGWIFEYYRGVHAH